MIKTINIGRGFFRIWLITSIVWVGIIGLISISTAMHDPLQYCRNAKNSKECMDILIQRNMDPFSISYYEESGGTFPPSNQYIGAASAIFYGGIVPCTVLFFFGVVIRWISRGFKTDVPRPNN